MSFAAKPPKPPKPGTKASAADPHKCYEFSVQAVDTEIDMIDQTFKTLRGRKATTLREDFCGTANTSCEWVRRRKSNRAIAVDYNQEVLDWGNENNLAKLNKGQQDRLTLSHCNVLEHGGEKVDVILAMNFSFQIFQTRDQLRHYFATAREGLTDDGVLFIDAFGGHESYRETKEKTRYKKFTYYWDQAKYDPITGYMLCYIHFKFKDGSWLKRAFSYEWRMYTLPELQEILYEAGFKNVIVYWEGTDEESGEGNGEYSPAEHGEDDPAWIVYLSAEK
jgi:cyclopropane fatty-acyl-phospholipid synthase-like methyltransferase